MTNSNAKLNMPDSLFYERVVPLNDTLHKKLRLTPLTTYGFSREVNSVPIVLAELAEVVKEYPIGFVKSAEGGNLPVALLGLRKKENLFVDIEDHWDAYYIPAFVRRYPFVPANGPNGQLLVCIDADADCLRSNEGQALFSGGNPAPVLEHALSYLSDFHASGLAAAATCRRLAEYGLFREVGTLAQVPGGECFQLSGLQVIDEDKLRALDAAAVYELFRHGDMTLIYAHLLSMGNMQRLVERLSKRLSA
jgi:hypothetical protein